MDAPLHTLTALPREGSGPPGLQELPQLMHETSTETRTEWRGTSSVVRVRDVRANYRVVLVALSYSFAVSRISDVVGGLLTP